MQSNVAKEARQQAVWKGIEMGGKSRCARQVLQSNVTKEARQQAVWKGIEMGGKSRCARRVLHGDLYAVGGVRMLSDPVLIW